MTLIYIFSAGVWKRYGRTDITSATAGFGVAFGSTFGV